MVSLIFQVPLLTLYGDPDGLEKVDAWVWCTRSANGS